MKYPIEAITLLSLLCAGLLPAQDLELARTKYELAVETADSEYQQSKTKLLGFYDQALDGVSLKAQRAGNLDGVTECGRERQRVEDDVFVSLDPDSGVDPAILNLRKKLSTGMRDIELKRKAELTKLYQNFARGADQMIIRLTKQGAINEARELKAMKDKFERQFVRTFGAKKEKKKTLIPNGDFEDGLAKWEVTGSVKSRTEVSLGTGRSQSFARLTAQNNSGSELVIPMPKGIEIGVMYQLTFRYRISSDFKTVSTYPGHPPSQYALNIGARAPGYSSSSSKGRISDENDGEWYTYTNYRSFRSADTKMMIGTQRGSGHVDVDDVELSPK